MEGVRSISPRTQLCAVIGNPVAHSLSPAIHNAAYEALGLDFVYAAFRVEDLPRAIAGLRALEGFRGLSVTIPHKIAVLGLVDEVAEVDRQIGAINTVVNERGRLVGLGTDGPGALKALVDAGVPFKESFWGQPGWEPPYDDGLMYSGGENAAPFNTLVDPAPRGHVPQMSEKNTGEKGGGYMLMKPLVETAEKLGVRAEYDLRVQTVVVDGDRVVGVVAKRYGKDVAIRARKGVVLAMGSFAYNNEMVRSNAPRIFGHPAASIEAHDGRAIQIGQALGADTAHMDATEVAFFCDPQLMVRGILVNGRGQRYIPEDTYPGRIGQATLFQQDNQAFLVIDEAAYEEGMNAESSSAQLRAQPSWVAETVEELEGEMGLPAGSLQSTVDLYNRHAAEGSDPVLGKKSEWVKPIVGPFAAIDLRGRTGGFTLGGLKTTVDSEVLHVSGAPIPGLFAAGRCTSGVCAGGYASGTSLGDGSFFGRRAGISAAR